MAHEDLANQLEDLNLTDAECLPFRPTEDVVRKFDEIPRSLFRVFTEKSCGTTNKTWAKSKDARDAAEDYSVDLFARDDKNRVADMISRHLWWNEGSDNLVSWTSSLLFALVYIFHRRANKRDRSIFDNISLCVIDTTCFLPGVFIRDMDLSTQIWGGWRTQGKRSFTLESTCHRVLYESRANAKLFPLRQ